MTNIYRPASLVMKLAKRRFNGRLVATTLLLTVLISGVWLQRATVLYGAADLWVASDPVTRSDVVAVLGGDFTVRPRVAAELYRKGLATKILISQVAEPRSTEIASIPDHTELNRMVLLKFGVPETGMENFGQANRSTFDEAVALRAWADEHHVSRIVVPTEIFSARRVRWIFNRQFAGSTVHIEVPSYEMPNYSRSDWWKTGWGIMKFQNEIIKYLYYRLKY